MNETFYFGYVCVLLCFLTVAASAFLASLAPTGCSVALKWEISQHCLVVLVDVFDVAFLELVQVE